jgi:hypothetical protein
MIQWWGWWKYEVCLMFPVGDLTVVWNVYALRDPGVTCEERGLVENL